MKPLVYIILVNYNGAIDTTQCVESLKKIRYSNYKIIIVDNASTDDSVSIIKNNVISDNCELLVSEENNGFSYGNNLAIKKALAEHADFVVLLNNDTIVEPDFLELLINAFERDSSIGVTTPKILYESDRNKIWYNGGDINAITGKSTHFDYGKSLENSKWHEGIVSFASGCCMCISRKVIEAIGLLDEDYFLYDEDADYCLRILNARFLINYVPQAVIYHKVSTSTSKVSGLIQYYMVRNKLMCIKKNYKGIRRYSAYLYSFLMFIKRLIFGEIGLRNFCRGVLDFNRHISGKKIN